MMVSHIMRTRNLPLLFVVLLFGFLVQGCVATRDWVAERLEPLTGRMSTAEGQLSQTRDRLSGAEGRLGEIDTRMGQVDAKTEKILSNLAHLRLQRRFVLDLKEGANFSFNVATLTDQAKKEVDSFLSDLKGDVEEMDGALFLIAGHTDSVGSEEYNYELGRRRAESVARYLIVHKKLDPLRVVTVSYGKNVPLADNATREGRGKNRRVEILVYQEAIASARVETEPRADAGTMEESERQTRTR